MKPSIIILQKMKDNLDNGNFCGDSQREFNSALLDYLDEEYEKREKKGGMTCTAGVYCESCKAIH